MRVGTSGRLTGSHSCEPNLTLLEPVGKEAQWGFVNGGTKRFTADDGRSYAMLFLYRKVRLGDLPDHVILTPDIPVFRTDCGELLSDPKFIDVLTAPAVNPGVARKRSPGC